MTEAVSPDQFEARLHDYVYERAEDRRDRSVAALEQTSDDDGSESHQRSGREVDTSGNDDHRHPERADRDDHRLARHREEVLRSEERVRRQDREDRIDDDDGDERA